MMHDAVFGGSAGGSENDSLAIFNSRIPGPGPLRPPWPPQQCVGRVGRNFAHGIYTIYI